MLWLPGRRAQVPLGNPLQFPHLPLPWQGSVARSLALRCVTPLGHPCTPVPQFNLTPASSQDLTLDTHGDLLFRRVVF